MISSYVNILVSRPRLKYNFSVNDVHRIRTLFTFREILLVFLSIWLLVLLLVFTNFVKLIRVEIENARVCKFGLKKGVWWKGLEETHLPFLATSLITHAQRRDGGVGEGREVKFKFEFSFFF